MKVIGKIDNGKYICEITHTEIEKFLNQYYNNLERLKVGDEIYLGKGYEFMNETKSALKETKKFIEANADIIKKIIEGIDVMGE